MMTNTYLVVIIVVIFVGLCVVVSIVLTVKVEQGLELDVGHDGRIVGADILVDVRLEVEHGPARLPEVYDLRLVRPEALLEKQSDFLQKVAALAAYRLR